ncbi:MAG TPA: PQQ-binding-like beta-propeller repeat protein [Tepidisphaeraceae bacterium]|nr:PQQ-binding-like beta-propeller repeat protein [Tepidisphaeraceae bacterium]
MDVLGVVPIFMSAGAAALPTLLAAVTSVTAVLLKPKEFLRICRQRPGMVSAVAATIIVVVAAGTWLWMKPASAAASVSQTGGIAPAGPATHYDWAAIAQNILNEHQQGRPYTKIAGTASAAPYVLMRDFTRCAYDGGAAPAELFPAWTYRYVRSKASSASFFSSPAVAGNRIYAAGAYPDAGYIGVIACVDATTGKQLWAINKAGDDFLKGFFSSPAVTQDGKYVIIGEGFHDDENCQLRCYDANDGRLRWGVTTSLHIESSPAIFGDLAVVGCGAIEGPDHKATGDTGHVLAVRISDGKEMWRQPVIDPESSPAIDDAGMVYIGSGFNGSAVVAIRSDSDAVLREKHLDRVAWKTPVAQPVTSAITLAGDLVIAGSGNSDFVYADPHPEGNVIALERATGKVRWQRKFPDAVLGALAARDGKVICSVRTGEVAALDLGDGHILWQTPVSGQAPVLAGCAFTGKYVYAVSDDGWLAILDGADGKVLSKKLLNDQNVPSEGKCLSGPQISNGRLIVGSETGGLRCFVGPRSGE